MEGISAAIDTILRVNRNPDVISQLFITSSILYLSGQFWTPVPLTLSESGSPGEGDMMWCFFILKRPG